MAEIGNGAQPSRDREVRLGWWLSSEEHDPRALVEQSVAAEAAGLRTVMISDHLQPWSRAQGHSPHVWTVIGAIAAATDELEVGTGVVALGRRNHPVTVAHAAATATSLLHGRFFLGVGTGERLNEQPFGDRWPTAGERRDALREGVEVMRELWRGSTVTHRGAHWAVEGLELASRPAEPPPVYVAASGVRSARLAGECGDGMIGVTADARLVDVFHGAGGDGRCVSQLHVSLAATQDAAVDQAFRWWPNAVVPPSILTELSRPRDFEAIAAAIGPGPIGDTVVCATGAEPVVAAVDRLVGAGFGTVYLHQVGDDQARLRDLVSAEIAPHYARSAATAAPAGRS